MPSTPSGPAPSPERRASSAAAAAADLLSLRPNKPPSVALRILRLAVGAGGTLPDRPSARSLPLLDDEPVETGRSSADRRRPPATPSPLECARASRSRSLERRAVGGWLGAGAKSQCGWLGTGSGRTMVLALADACALDEDEREGG